jgi:CheY-like chemotaxis protein
LRSQAAVLTYRALTGEPGRFAFEPGGGLPPMFQAFPLQSSLAALAVEGVRRCAPPGELAGLVALHFARHTPRGGNVDRAGLGANDVRVHTLLDGAEPVSAVAAKVGLSGEDAAAVARGLELAGQVERRTHTACVSILLLEDDAESVRTAQRVLGAEGEGYQLRHVRDRVAAQLLLRRNAFALVMLPIDNPDQEAFYRSIREHAPADTRFVGVLRIDEEGQLDRLDALGLDGVVHRPLSETDLKATVRQLLEDRAAAGIS